MFITKLILSYLTVAFVLHGTVSSEYISPERIEINRVITEQNEIMGRRTVEFIESAGYPFEQHVVQTADGYLLTMHRIPYGRHSGPASNKPVVFLQHGLLCSSADWVLNGPTHGLAFILADEGYDVWMGNARGNTHSRAHIHLNPASAAFWNFSWHQIGQFDLPAMIDFALARTGQSALHYIGHSQGTTAFFVMGAIRPEYNARIRSMHALAPVAFMSNLVSPFIRALSIFVDQIELVMNLLGINEFLPNHDMMVRGGYLTCRDESPFQEVCAFSLFLIGGFNSEQLNRTIIPTILSVTPAGASVNQLVHYGQGVNSGRFRMYDHGLFGNLAEYGQLTPPDYDLARITAPVALHFGDNDWLAAVSDVQQLFARLGNPIGLFRVPHNRWNHLDFQWAIDARPLLFDRIISLMARY